MVFLRRLVILIIVALFGGFSGITAFSQDLDKAYVQIWTDLFLQQTLNNNFRFLFHANYKHLMDDRKWDQYMIRPTIVYTMSDYVYFQGGIQVLYTDQGKLNKLEIRPWQGMNVFFPRIGGIHINHFIRLEERFFYQNIGEGQSSSLRARYALMTNVPINHPVMGPKTVYLWPNIEFLGDLWGENVERFIASTRYSLGLGYQFDGQLRCESVYMLERARDRAKENFRVANHIVRFIVRYNFKKHNSKSIGL
jgi:hypothetical protein